MTPDADVYQGTTLVAHLQRTDGGTALSFVPGVSLENGFLASRLPPQAGSLETIDLHPFFLNLLPEGARLRLLLEGSRSKDDSLGLLLRLGWDTIGDVAVLPNGTPPAAPRVSVPGAKLSEVSFWDLFYEGVGEFQDAAVPGVQEKISSSAVAFGVRLASVPSAILKLNPKAYPRLVQNEEFFLRMARGCGLETCKAVLVQDRLGEPGLLVTRFDRVKHGRNLRKLHQEDACQLLNAVPGNKYSVALRRIAETLCQVCTAPVVETERLLKLYAFSFLIGNGDLHAKNISVLWSDAVRLAPAYDLLSTLPYPVDNHMALPLEGRNDNFRTADFVAFGLRHGVPERATRSMIATLCQRAGPWIERVGEIGFDAKTTAHLMGEMKERMAKLLR